MISKIKGTCRNKQRPGGDVVFGEFFLKNTILKKWLSLLYRTGEQNTPPSKCTHPRGRESESKERHRQVVSP